MAYYKCGSVYTTQNSNVVIDTASGPIANFQTPLAMPLIKSWFNFKATQEAGTPTPQSPKAITGVNAVNFYHFGKNLLKTNEISLVVPSDTTFSNLTKRIFQNNSYCVGLASNNYYNPALITSYEVSNNNVKINSVSQAYGLAIAVNLKAGVTYNLSFTTIGGKVTILFYDSDGSWLSNTNEITSSGSFVVPNSAKQCIILFRPTTNDALATFTNIQIEFGSSASNYEPYIAPANTFINLGGTYFGGRFIQDKDGKRKFEVTHERVDLGTLNWFKQATNLFYTQNNSIKGKSVCACEIYAYQDVALPPTRNDKTINTATYFGLHSLSVYDTDYDDRATFKNSLSGKYCVYELATPYIIDLPDGQPIKSFAGVNNIFADTGDTSVKFRKIGD